MSHILTPVMDSGYAWALRGTLLQFLLQLKYHRPPELLPIHSQQSNWSARTANDTLATGGLDWLSLSLYGTFRDLHWATLSDLLQTARKHAEEWNDLRKLCGSAVGERSVVVIPVGRIKFKIAAIEYVNIGERLLKKTIPAEVDDFVPDIIPSQWRLLHLTMHKANGKYSKLRFPNPLN